MIEPRKQPNGLTMPTYVGPPNATLDGKYPTHIMGHKLTAFGVLAVQQGVA